MDWETTKAIFIGLAIALLSLTLLSVKQRLNRLEEKVFGERPQAVEVLPKAASPAKDTK